jgi:hypothetical protein
METISLKLGGELKARLEAEAKRRQISKSKVIRDCLTRVLLRSKSGNGVSCYDLAKHLAGSVHGPRDLSTNKKHMKGFGE